MEIHQLKYFVALTQELNFQRAAKRAHISQPSLSHAIMKLEKELNQCLLERSPQGVRLTAAGVKFLPHAISVLDQLGECERAMQEDAKEISGHVRLSVIPTIAPYILPDVVNHIRDQAPFLSLEIYEQTTAALIDDLKKGSIDLGLLSLPIKDAGLACRSLGHEEIYLAVSNKHSLTKKSQILTHDIAKEKLLILQEEHCFGHQALAYCKRSRKDQQVVFQAGSLTSVLRMAGAGQGVAFVPQMAAEKTAGLKYLRFKNPEPRREIGIVWRVSAPLSRASRFLIETVEKVFKMHSP